jgi:hypothetical protein
MHRKNKQAIDFLFYELVLPVGITAFFFFYTIFNNEPLVYPSDGAIWFIQWMLAVVLAPVVLIFELIEKFTGLGSSGVGSGTWSLKLFSYWLYAILITIVLFRNFT